MKTQPHILLLGKDGQVGSALAPLLEARGALFAHNRATCNLRDEAQIRDVIRSAAPEVIINAAAYTVVDRAESETEACRQINAVAPQIIAEEATARNAKLIHFSTDYVFDGTKNAPYSEEDTPCPVNVYGQTKLEGDRAVLSAGNHLIFRVSWVYGLAGSNFARTIMRLASERDELRVVADQFGAPTSAELIAKVTSRVIDQYLALDPDAATEVGGLFNLAPAGTISWHGYAVALIGEAARLGHRLHTAVDRIFPIPSEEYKTAATRPKNSALATQKLRETFMLDLPEWEVDVKKFVAHWAMGL